MPVTNSKIYSIILYVLMGVSAVLYLLFAAEVISHALLINWCYLLFIIAGSASLIFPIISMTKDFKKAMSSLIGIVALAVIFIVGYILSTDEAYKIGESIVEGTASKSSEAGLITFYVMIFLAIGSIIFAEISKAFK
ncbi:MAG: hypothetical protein RIC15_03860 [Vicingaceae bacterium]